MLLMRGMANAAVMAGVDALAVKRVSRRQSGRWAEQPGAGAPAQPDVLAQLKQLGELKASGVLTEAEFVAQKAKILSSG